MQDAVISTTVRRDRLLGLAAILLVIGAVFRVVATYPYFWQTYDEPAHLAGGMQWLDEKRYVYEPHHAPLARIAIAAAPYLDGLRSTGQANFWDEGNAILHSRGTYEHNLVLARIGVLPFFIVAALIVWYWTRQAFGAVSALGAVALFSTLPPILAHSGFATTETALVAFLGAAFLAICQWLERPRPWQAALMGFAFALALLSKFSALLFVAAGGAGLWLVHFHFYRAEGTPPVRYLTAYVPSLLLAGVVAGLVVWMGYRFSVAPLVSDGPTHPRIDQVVGQQEWLKPIVYAIAETVVIPAPELFTGIKHVLEHNERGHTSFLLGDVRTHGWWYFFPVSLAVKTPIPFMILACFGVLALVRQSALRQFRTVAPLLLAGVMLVVVLPSSINIGVRHVLPIYLFLSILAGAGIGWLLSNERFRVSAKLLVALLVGWQVSASVLAHPDYLSWFNGLAGERPENIVIDSDLDWGQDLKRLAAVIREEGIKEIHVAYHGSASPDKLLPTKVLDLPVGVPVVGWIAVSQMVLKTGGYIAPYDGYRWLSNHIPVRVIGSSILLFHIPASSEIGLR